MYVIVILIIVGLIILSYILDGIIKSKNNYNEIIFCLSNFGLYDTDFNNNQIIHNDPVNKNNDSKFLDLIKKVDTNNFKLPWVVGLDTNGNIILKDISEAPHILIAGCTGSGKSVALNTLICSLILSTSSADVELILIDPKMIELNFYSSIPHLRTNIITEINEASSILDTIIKDMNNRYKLLADVKVKSLEALYQKTKIKLKRLVICFDEFADFTLQDKSIQNKITLIAQKSRACGIHLVIATQKPIKEIIDTKIKANIPVVIALRTTNKNESRVILDMNGCEILKGKGDMQIKDINGMTRVQGSFISDDDIENICNKF